MTNKKQAFTLIELLVVITIIGLLSTLAVFALNSASMKARDAKRMSDLKMISEALEIYNMDNNTYPLGSYFVPLNEEPSCGLDGILDYFVVEGANVYVYFCSGHPLQNNGEIYINSIPESPNPDLDVYHYEDYGPVFGLPIPPCVYSLLETLEDGNYMYFVCSGGNCQKTNDYNPICYPF